MSVKKPIELKVFVINEKKTPNLKDGVSTFTTIHLWDLGLEHQKDIPYISCGCIIPDNKKLKHALASVDKDFKTVNPKYMYLTFTADHLRKMSKDGLTLTGPEDILLTFILDNESWKE